MNKKLKFRDIMTVSNKEANEVFIMTTPWLVNSKNTFEEIHKAVNTLDKRIKQLGWTDYEFTTRREWEEFENGSKDLVD